MAKVNYSISAWEELCLPTIIIIHSTNVEVVIMMRNCGRKGKQEGKTTTYSGFLKKIEEKNRRKIARFDLDFFGLFIEARR